MRYSVFLNNNFKFPVAIRFLTYTVLVISVGACTAPVITTSTVATEALLANPAISTDLRKTTHIGNTPMCDGFIADARAVTIPMIPKPPVGARYLDPSLGATVVRVSDSAIGEVHKPAYSTMQAWNADESLMLLYQSGSNGSGHQLRDGHSYELIRQLDFYPADIEEVFWSHVNPDELFYVSAAKHDFGHFKRLNPHTNDSETIADFSAWCGTSLPVAGSDVHMQSNDDDLFGFRCEQVDRGHIMFSYRISDQSVSIQNIDEDGLSLIAPVPTPGGRHFWYRGETLDITLAMSALTLDLYSYSEHSSVGSTAGGQGALYQVAFNPSPHGCDGDDFDGVGHLVEHNLETGACRNIISQQQGYPYPTSSTHISALANKRPGWVALSSIGTLEQTKYFTNGEAAPALFSEIYLSNTRSNKVVTCRLAHHRSSGKNAVNGGYKPYFGEPHATISPSATRILFGSDWYDSGAVDAYVVELPGYVKP